MGDAVSTRFEFRRDPPIRWIALLKGNRGFDPSKVRLSRVVEDNDYKHVWEGWRVITGLTTQSVRYRSAITTPSESASHSPLQLFNPSSFILIILFRIKKNLWAFKHFCIYLAIFFFIKICIQ